MPAAIVTGATGILGRAVVLELSKNREKWPTVHALSRGQKEYPENIVHHCIDLMSSADEMAHQLGHIEAEYVFFCAYLQGKDEQENWDINGDMLENFLSALRLAGISKSLKRVVLVTGAKQYGVHLGLPKNPMQETDPWLSPDEHSPSRPPNFYYRQQRILHRYAAQEPWDWVVTYPNDVVGFARGNFMNLGSALGLYASVCRELGQPLAWPGSETFYTKFDCLTSSKLHAKFCHWAALEPRAGNEAFNVVNGDVESFQNLWPRVATRFGLRVPPDQFLHDAPDGKVTQLAETPPLAAFADEAGLVGKVGRQQVEMRIDLNAWSQRDDVKAAWTRLAEREGLEHDAFEKATWGFLNFVLGRNYDLVISMSKARKLGWTGYIDSWEALDGCFADLEEAKIIPKHRS